MPRAGALLRQPGPGLKFLGTVRDAFISPTLSLHQVLGSSSLEQAGSLKTDGASVRMGSYVLDHGWSMRRLRGAISVFVGVWSGSIGHPRTTADQPTCLCRVLGRPAGFGGASLLFLPAIGRSISPCPWTRLCPFFEGADAAFSWATLRRSASVRFTRFCGRGTARSRDTSMPACFFLSISTMASS